MTISTQVGGSHRRMNQSNAETLDPVQKSLYRSIDRYHSVTNEYSLTSL